MEKHSRATHAEENSRATLIDEQALLLENLEVGPNLFVMTLESPRIAKALLPGQFVHVRIPGMEAHILRRPFSIYETFAKRGTLDILYQVVGFGTEHLSRLEPGNVLDQLGPVGRPWDKASANDRLLAVAGGAGAPSLYMQVKATLEAGGQADVILGAQSADALVTRERFANLLGHEPILATDDGTIGYKGFAIQPTIDALAANDYNRVITCGPNHFMHKVADAAAAAHVACQVSMEKYMACGVGACLSCVVDTVDGKRRACVDGPIFDAQKVVW